MTMGSGDRYMNSSIAQTSRNTDSKTKHPPKLSPRAANKSVDPLVRKANLLTNMPMKSTGGFGPTIRNAFNSKK